MTQDDSQATSSSKSDQAEADSSSETHQVTVFAAVGGQAFFDNMVERFYARVATDPVLLRLYPEQSDLGPAIERLALFLGQYWGGPDTYGQKRGHPRLRMRHVPFTIGDTERAHWLDAMLKSLAETIPETPLDRELQDAVEERMTEYFTLSAKHLVNSPES
ncbi:MAG TPA: globin [Microthrixaceae bacterium]|nr:globin [Microthrixaceae bacterium]